MKKILYSALAATFLLVSCSKDGDAGNTAPETGIETKMGLSFTMPNTSETRVSDGDDITGLPAESVVNNVQVFIFNNDGSYDKLGGYYDIPLTSFTPAGTTYTLNDDEALDVMTGGKRIYVGINLPASFKGKTSVANEAALKVAKALIIDETAAGNTNLVGTNGIAMFSEGTKTQSLQPKAEGSDATPPANMVSLNVVRMVAKVVAQTNSPTNAYAVKYNDGHATNEFLASYTVQGFAIGQGSNSMYMLQSVESNRLVTPGSVNDFDLVAESFEGINNSSLGTADFSNHKYIYTGENASKSWIVKEATYMLVKTKIKPDKKASVSGEDVILSTGTFTDHMWVVRGTVTDGEQEIYFCDNETDADAVAAKCGGTYQKYPGCYVYFRVWLNLTDNVNDKLAIYRNQFVHVSITDINGSKFSATRGLEPDGEDPEDPTNPKDPEDPKDPEKPDPEDPIIEEPTDMLVKVTIKPWSYIGNSVILGQ